jgi:hypothetical protein
MAEMIARGPLIARTASPARKNIDRPAVRPAVVAVEVRAEAGALTNRQEAAKTPRVAQEEGKLHLHRADHRQNPQSKLPLSLTSQRADLHGELRRGRHSDDDLVSVFPLHPTEMIESGLHLMQHFQFRRLIRN